VVAWLGTLTTPGWRVASVVQSRPFNGSSRTVVPFTVALTAEEEVWTLGGAALTITVWDNSPTARAGLKVCSALTVRIMFFCTWVEKPLAEVLTS